MTKLQEAHNKSNKALWDLIETINQVQDVKLNSQITQKLRIYIECEKEATVAMVDRMLENMKAR